MTPAELAYWRKATRRAAQLEPELAAALLRAFAILRDTLPDHALRQLVSSGDVDRLFREYLTPEVFDRAFIPYRQRIRQGLERNFRIAIADLPRGGKIDGVVAVAFDTLSPNVIAAIRALDTKITQTLTTDTRETVRAFVENGLRDGRSPAAVAREIRSTIGLAPNQEEAVRNFRRALEGAEGARNPLAYKLRDRRFDAAITKGNLTPEKIDKMVEAYRRKMVAFNSATNAKTAALDAQKAANRLTWEQAAESGAVDRERIVKTWRGVLDDREREEHLRAEGETVGLDEPFPTTGEQVPGESTYNCRCIAIYRVAPARP